VERVKRPILAGNFAGGKRELGALFEAQYLEAGGFSSAARRVEADPGRF